MLPSVVLPGSAPATIYKDQVEAVVARHRMAPGAAPTGSVRSQHTYHVIHTTKE